MVTLPPAEDRIEQLMDRKPIRFSLDLDLVDYRRLVAEQHRRQADGERVTLRAIILAALDAYLTEPR